jgi:hypothetical protein
VSASLARVKITRRKMIFIGSLSGASFKIVAFEIIKGTKAEKKFKGDDFDMNGENQCVVVKPVDLTSYNESNTQMYTQSEQYVKNYLSFHHIYVRSYSTIYNFFILLYT